jgi:hypothetical protein
MRGAVGLRHPNASALFLFCPADYITPPATARHQVICNIFEGWPLLGFEELLEVGLRVLEQLFEIPVTLLVTLPRMYALVADPL